ncbi:3292_t:CDS:2, partial [Cetraspora pellucida]
NPKLKEIALEAGEQLWLVKFEEDQQLEKKKLQTLNSNPNSKNSNSDSEDSDLDSEDSNSDSEDSNLDSEKIAITLEKGPSSSSINNLLSTRVEE